MIGTPKVLVIEDDEDIRHLLATRLHPHRTDPGVPLATSLTSHGERVALATCAGPLTYRELDERVRRAAEQLGSVRRLVLVAMANEVEPIVWYLAALQAGHPVLLADGRDHRHLDALLRTYDPDVVVSGAAGTWSVDERRAGSAHVLHPDLALLLCTSGTTGSPRLVRLSAGNVQANAEAIARYLGVGETDLAATTLPPHYCYGLSVLNSHLLAGAGLLLTDLSVVDGCFWERFVSEGATMLAGVPYTFELLDRVGFPSMSLPSLRCLTQAGGRLPPETVRRYAALGRRDGWDLFVMYGQTEATARMAYLPPELALEHPGSIGVPIPGGSFHLEPVEGAAEGTGELVYRGPNVMLGYADDATDLATGPTVEELRTGDLARRTPDGIYELVGRRSRFVKLFGLRIDLDRVESVLAAHGIPSICTGDDDGLVVAITQDHDVDRVRATLDRELGLPDHRLDVLALAGLPRLSNGKPDHVAVRDLAAARRAADRAGPDDATVPADVRAIFAEVLRAGEVTDDDTFVGLGGDSLSYVELSIRLEGALGHLPAGWHTKPVGQLQPTGAARTRRTTQIETNVVLRAAAIVTVVGTHAGLFDRRGGAHILLAVAGFNFARFQLRHDGRSATGQMLRSTAHIAIPAILWIGALVALTDDYSVPTALLLNNHLGSPVFDERWRFWFVEALVQILLVLTLAFAIPAVRRTERRWPFALPLGLTLLALPLRFEVLDVLDVRHHTVQPQTIAWLFLLGWAAARAASAPQRLLVSAVAVLGTPGFFFGDPRREALVAAGVLLLVWVPRMAVPRPLHRLVGPLAAASLHIYLTHWLVFPAVAARTSPAVAVLASLAVGIAVWSFATRRPGRRNTADVAPSGSRGARR